MIQTSIARLVAITVRDAAACVLRSVPGDSRWFGPPRHAIEDTPAWAGTQPPAGAAVRSLSPSRNTRRVEPAFADGPIRVRFAAMRQGIIKPRFVAELPSGRFWGRGYGYVVDAEDALHCDLSPCFGDFDAGRNGRRRPHDALRQPFLPRLGRVSGNVAAMGTLFCENFHHWLLDTVPKFGLLRDSGWSFDRVDAFLLPTGARRRWHLETLRRLNIPERKIGWTNQRTHVEAARLLVPSYSEPGREPEKYDYTREGLGFVRELFLLRGARRTDLPGSIVVSREHTCARRWRAGDAGHARLERAGFVKVCLERHTLDEQAALFAHARRIVMPTGGGLANLAFCSPGARVIELFSPAYLPTFSLALAGALELDYRAVVGEDIPGVGGHSDSGGAEDITVPVERVLDQLS